MGIHDINYSYIIFYRIALIFVFLLIKKIMKSRGGHYGDPYFLCVLNLFWTDEYIIKNTKRFE